MRMRVSSALVIAALLVLPGLLFAQAAPAAAPSKGTTVTLVYHTDDSGTFEVHDASGAVVSTVQDGDTLGVGWTVLTGKGDVAELQIDPTKTIIKLAGGTSFKIEGLRSDLTKGTDVFSLASGKLRTVAGRASGKDQYQVKTQSAVCGVRGTDALIEFLNNQVTTFAGTAFVLVGDVETDVPAGFSFNTLANQLSQLTADALAAAKEGMDFVKASVADAEAAHQAELTEQGGTAAGGGQAGGGTGGGEQQTPPPPKTNPFLDSIMAKLRDILGMEIGSVTISGKTWATAVIQPTFTIGQLKASLYLPIIYSGDMFNPADWYHPEGNNEWSFGTDPQFQNQPLLIAGDVISDLFLKIKYIEWGQQRDPFFFKVGNLSDITIGHGLIMRNFANDADFPSVRRVGLNFGMDFGGFGLEAMVNDLRLDPPPDIVGARVYFRPVQGFKAAIGLSTILDLEPGKDWPGAAPGIVDPMRVGDPIFINPGVDLDIPFVESDVFGLVAFADAALMVPYFRSVPTDPTYAGIGQGLITNAIIDTSATLPVKNWGVAAGLFGNLIIKDFTWRLEFRDYTGSFIPQFYSSAYERTRTARLGDVLAYLNNPAAAQYQTPTLGIFGEGGLTLAKLFSLNLSYFWPWSQDGAGSYTFGNDQFVASFTLEKGVIPVVNIWGTVSYQRTNFVPTLIQNGAGKGLSLFDANTVVSATINYPVTDTLDVTLLYTTTAKRDPVTGDIVYDPNSPGGLLPQLDTSLAIQTEVHL